jgi:hypothetical protein
MEIVFFEKVLIRFLFIDEKIRDKVLPFLIPEIFEDHKNVRLIQAVMAIMSKYEHFPSVPEMRI